jgi:peroxiredoxin
MAQLKAGAKAPDVTVKALNGKSVRLSQLRGSAPAVVNFFATW